MKAKDIILKPISSKDARNLVIKYHYSKKFVNNSKINFGVFLNNQCGGVLQFGTPMDKKKVINLVEGTRWNGFLELNRMAFADWLPKNSESRAISIAIKLIKKNYPFINWILSFADATQCGDGTIYRASGFLLTGIKKNTNMYRMPNGEVCCKLTFAISNAGFTSRRKWGEVGTDSEVQFLKRIGATCLTGYQLRYIYLIDKNLKNKLTVPILDFSEIAKIGASMYKGKRICE